MVVTSSKINAADYNGIYTPLSSIVAGYGGSMRSSAVTGGSTYGVSNSVTAEQLLDLFLDLQAVYVHQFGVPSSTIAPPDVGYLIAADTTQNFNQTTGEKVAVSDGNFMGINDYVAVYTDIANFNPIVSGFPPGNLTPSTGANSTRTSSSTWGGAGEVQKIYHIVQVTFTDAAERQAYFTAGGEVRFTATVTGGTGSKTNDWNSLLSAMGTIKLNKWNLTASSGTSAGLGEEDLTSTYQQLFIKAGSGVYADNDYTIEGREVNATTLRFRITFDDGDVGTGEVGNPETTPIDESVDGTTSSTVTPARPDSSFVFDLVTYPGIDVAAPSVTNSAVLTTDYISTPV